MDILYRDPRGRSANNSIPCSLVSCRQPSPYNKEVKIPIEVYSGTLGPHRLKLLGEVTKYLRLPADRSMFNRRWVVLKVKRI